MIPLRTSILSNSEAAIFSRHIDADHAAGGADFLGGDEQVDPGSGAEVQNRVAFLDLAERQRVATAEGIDHSVIWQGLEVLACIAGEFGGLTL
jgi:hypothetical protein